MTYQQIEIKHLDRSPLNARKTDGHAAMEELKASIVAHGLMQNLVVVPAKKGRYAVIAGGRRLEALTQLRDEGKISDDHAVPCRIADPAEAAELSLAENTVREAMHPADEFEAFATLIEKGQTAAQVAERFGATEKHVLQRMKLGRVAPKLLAAYREGEVTLDALMAFAITDDHKRQLSVWKSLEGWQVNNARQIRSRLTDTMTEADDGMVQFVGLEAYKAAGGGVRADLFSDVVYLENPELLEQLAAEKLEAETDKLRAEGWGWVEIENDNSIPSYRCSRIKAKPVGAPEELLAEKQRLEDKIRDLDEAIEATWETDDEEEQERLDADLSESREGLEMLGEKLEAFMAFDPEEMKAAGCLVSVNRDGELDIERGLVKPEERKSAASEREDDSATGSSAKKEKPEFSQSLIADMKAYRCQVAQVEIASHPDIAFDLLVFHVACDLLSLGGFLRKGLGVNFQQSFPRPSIESKNAATEKLESIRDGLPLAWLEIDGEDARFHAFRELSDADKKRILAFCTALTLKPSLAGEGEFPSAYEVALSLIGGNVAEYWRPTKDNYLSRVTKDQLLDIGREVMLGGEQWATSRSNEKKSSLAATLHDAFARSHLPDTIDKLKNWLPKGMAFRAVAKEAEAVAAPKKSRKASKAKRAA